MSHLSGSDLPLAAVSNFGKGVSDIESGHKLFLSYDKGMHLNTTRVCSTLPRPSTKTLPQGHVGSS